MTPTKRAYVGGIIDGEGWVVFRRLNGKPSNYARSEKELQLINTLIVRLEVPQVDGRLIDYLMETTKEGTET